MQFGKVASRAIAIAVSLSIVGLAVLPGTSQAKASKKVKTTLYYVSLGDSYSVGYQPAPTSGATSGYTGYVASKLKMNLENFGCGGATSESLNDFTGVCGVDQYGPPAATDAGVIPPGDSQVEAADAFITAHPGQIGLITVSIGGNDVTPCAAASGSNPVNEATNPVTCVEAGDSAIQTNVTEAVGQLE